MPLFLFGAGDHGKWKRLTRFRLLIRTVRHIGLWHRARRKRMKAIRGKPLFQFNLFHTTNLGRNKQMLRGKNKSETEK